MPDSHNRMISVIIELSKKEFEIMAVKYTEEQLNRMDKSLLITMFLGLQEQSETLSDKLTTMDRSVSWKSMERSSSLMKRKQ